MKMPAVELIRFVISGDAYFLELIFLRDAWYTEDFPPFPNTEFILIPIKTVIMAKRNNMEGGKTNFFSFMSRH